MESCLIPCVRLLYIIVKQRFFTLYFQASNNVDVLKDHEAVKQLGSILKTNVRACKALGKVLLIIIGQYS